MPKSGGTFTGDITMGPGTNLVLSDGTNVGAELYNISTTANAAMPRSGGTFTGVVNGQPVTASSWSFKNISVHTSAWGDTGTNVQRIIMIRK